MLSSVPAPLGSPVLNNTEHSYRILNMRSDLSDDRSTKARIRDAAIQCIADNGFSATTARKVAEAADVSPALVIHHFGSMDALRAACDEYVTDVIRRQKSEALSSGPSLDILQALRGTEFGPLLAYVARVLTDRTPTVTQLIDDLVNDAEEYIQQGVDSGMLQPSPDPRGRAVVLTLWGLGGLVLHEHMDRLLGVDLTDPDILNDPGLVAYIRPVYEIYGSGIFTEAFAAQTTEALSAITSKEYPSVSKSNEGAT